jgi:hypothetical protein
MYNGMRHATKQLAGWWLRGTATTDEYYPQILVLVSSNPRKAA